MAVRTGLEPATSCVTGRHSNQLNYRTILRGQDSNLRPPGYEPDELPDCSTPRCASIVGMAWSGSSPRRQRSLRQEPEPGPSGRIQRGTEARRERFRRLAGRVELELGQARVPAFAAPREHAQFFR